MYIRYNYNLKKINSLFQFNYNINRETFVILRRKIKKTLKNK